MKPLEFDLNEPPPFDNEVREAGQPCIHHVPMAPAERSLQPQVYPSRGPIEVVELDSDDEDEDNHEDEGGDDDDDDGEDDDYDDDGDDDIGDEEEDDDNDDGYSYDDEDVSSGQASSSLSAHGRTSSIDSESLQIAVHQRILRRRVEPQPRVNVCDFTVDLGGTRSSMTEPVAPPPPLAPMSNHPTGMRLVEASSSSMLHVAPVAPPPPLQLRPTFTCPICLDCIVEETSTSCGHIFCKVCIEHALLTTDQCPMCRRKITHRGIHRIHFEDPL